MSFLLFSAAFSEKRAFGWKVFLEIVFEKVLDFDKFNLSLRFLRESLGSIFGRRSENQVSFSLVVLLKLMKKFTTGCLNRFLQGNVSVGDFVFLVVFVYFLADSNGWLLLIRI